MRTGHVVNAQGKFISLSKAVSAAQKHGNPREWKRMHHGKADSGKKCATQKSKEAGYIVLLQSS